MVDLTLPPETREVRQRVRTFVEEHVLPAEEEGILEDDSLDEDVIARLRKRARDEGLWCPHLPEAWGGMDLGAVALAHVHQELGASPLGPYALNSMAPDEGNMHALLAFGTEEQKETYLRPLAEARVRSCFAMTEPDVAGSDPSTIQTTAVRDGDQWVINGRKWFATGAAGAGFAIVVALTDPEAHHYEGQTLFLVDTDSEGWRFQREVPTMGTHGPGGHGEIVLDDVRVPEENVLGEVGHGLQHAQERLSLGRTTHCMRWIGQAQRGLDMMADRALRREAFGSKLGEHQAIQWMLADSARELRLARLAVLDAAVAIEQGRDPKYEVSAAKVFVARVLQDILDRAIQVHGALGYSKDTLLERFFRDARAARIYDGADEVHQWVQARSVLKAYEEHGTTRTLTGGDR